MILNQDNTNSDILTKCDFEFGYGWDLQWELPSGLCRSKKEALCRAVSGGDHAVLPQGGVSEDMVSLRNDSFLGMEVM